MGDFLQEIGEPLVKQENSSGASTDSLASRTSTNTTLESAQTLDRRVTDGMVNNPSSDRPLTSPQDGSQYICGPCGSSFATSHELEQHAKTTLHKAYVCAEAGCAKGYARRDTYARHLATHRNIEHVCTHCVHVHKAFKRKDHLTQHLLNSHSDRAHLEVASLPGHATAEQQSHTLSGQTVSENAGFVSGLEGWTMERSVSSTTSAATSVFDDRESIPEDGTNPYVCSICSRSFRSSGMLEQHAKAEKHRIYSCRKSGCGKSYYRRDLYTRHKSTHDKKDAHVCHICAENHQHKAFSRKDHLHQHTKDMHPWAEKAPIRLETPERAG